MFPGNVVRPSTHLEHATPHTTHMFCAHLRRPPRVAGKRLSQPVHDDASATPHSYSCALTENGCLCRCSCRPIDERVLMEDSAVAAFTGFTAGNCTNSGHLLCLRDGTGKCNPHGHQKFAHPRSEEQLKEFLRGDNIELRDKKEGWCLCASCYAEFRAATHPDPTRGKTPSARRDRESVPTREVCPCCKIESEIFGSPICEQDGSLIQMRAALRTQISAPVTGCTLGYDDEFACAVGKYNIGVSYWHSLFIQEHKAKTSISKMSPQSLIMGAPHLCRWHTQAYTTSEIGTAFVKIEHYAKILNTALGNSHHSAPGSPAWNLAGSQDTSPPTSRARRPSPSPSETPLLPSQPATSPQSTPQTGPPTEVQRAYNHAVHETLQKLYKFETVTIGSLRKAFRDTVQRASTVENRRCNDNDLGVMLNMLWQAGARQASLTNKDSERILIPALAPLHLMADKQKAPSFRRRLRVSRTEVTDVTIRKVGKKIRQELKAHALHTIDRQNTDKAFDAQGVDLMQETAYARHHCSTIMCLLCTLCAANADCPSPRAEKPEPIPLRGTVAATADTVAHDSKAFLHGMTKRSNSHTADPSADKQVPHRQVRHRHGRRPNRCSSPRVQAGESRKPLRGISRSGKRDWGVRPCRAMAGTA